MMFELQIDNAVRKVELLRDTSADADQPDAFVCLLDGRRVAFQASIVRPGVLSLLLQGRSYTCLLDHTSEGMAVLVQGRRYPFTVQDPRSLRGRGGRGAGTEGPKAIKAPMPGRVVRVLVEAGATVEAQQGLVVIEAMKMQNELKSPKAGTVVRIAVAVGDTVQAGDVLAVVE